MQFTGQLSKTVNTQITIDYKCIGETIQKPIDKQLNHELQATHNNLLTNCKLDKQLTRELQAINNLFIKQL